jgi:tetratricopeptide (TPR) repeat protein
LLRQSVQFLVALDSLLGGDDAAALALRLFAAARRRLTDAGWGGSERAGVLSAAAELAEVTGWLLFDANRQSAATELNHQALLLAQLSRERGVEVLTLQNMSLQALWCGQSAESLALAHRLQQLTGGHASARLGALLNAREARALAQLGRRQEALRAFDRARSAFQEGPSPRDPSWTWWLDEAEFNYHEGQMRADLQDWAAAEIHLREAVMACPQNRPRDRMLYRAYLLDALIRMKAESEAIRLIEEQAAGIGEIRSSRTAAVLNNAIGGVDTEKGSPALREASHELRDRLALAGYPA